jgi:predicted ATPase/DNA-binding SARP family transcriptional activator
MAYLRLTSVPLSARIRQDPGQWWVRQTRLRVRPVSQEPFKIDSTSDTAASREESGALEFAVLGPLEARHGAKRLNLGAPKQRALLARLLLEADRYVGLDRLIDELWPQDPPTSARHAIQVYISDLRQTLSCGDDGPGLIARSGDAYALRLGDGWLDLRVFERLVMVGRGQLERGDSAGSAETLRAALALWRGPALAELHSFPAMRQEAERLAELRLGAIEVRIEADLKNAHHVEVVPELEALVQEHPLREGLRMQLMLALYRAGRQAEALDTYRQTRELFVSQLGIEPSRSLQELERAILRREATLEPRLESSRRSKIPPPLTSLVGRGDEVDEVRELILRREVRLVTLTGVGGVGKTRLAIKTVEELAGDYDDGVFFVELASLSQSSLVIDAIAGALGTTEALAQRIDNERILIVLDNFEHLLEAGPRVGELLRACPNLDVLATSRERLRLTGEHVFDVPPLPLNDAVTLFCERALAVNRRFASDGDVRESRDVREICRRLEGLPLAIELAAARVDAMPLPDLVQRLSRRLSLLEQGPRDAPQRQQTLRAALEWSYELLNPREQTLFAHLSVFAGGCTLKAAKTVAGADRAGLTSLVDKNLVRKAGDRFGMLETVREYAVERFGELGDAGEVRQRHVSLYVNLADDLRQAMRLGDRAATDTMAAELDNFRAILAESLEGNQPAPALSLLFSLYYLWLTRGYIEEASIWADRTLAAAEALAPKDKVWGLIAASEIRCHAGNVDEGLQLKIEAIAVLRRLGNDRALVGLLDDVAEAVAGQGDLERARAMNKEALRLSKPLGERVLIGHVLSSGGSIELVADDPSRARELLLEALGLFQEAGAVSETAKAELTVAHCSQRLGELEEARWHLVRALRLFADLGHLALMPAALQELAAILADEGDLGEAVLMLAASEKIRTDVGIPRDDLREFERTLRDLKADLSPKTFSRLWDTGSAIETDQAIQHALQRAARNSPRQPGEPRH